MWGFIAYMILLGLLTTGAGRYLARRFYFDTPKVKAKREAAQLAETEAWLDKIRAKKVHDA